MCNLSSATFIKSSGLQLSWCLGIFPSIHKCVFLFSHSYSSSQYENHGAGVFLSKVLSHTYAANGQQGCFTGYSLSSKFSVFFISKQTISQIDTDSDNTINQTFLQKCPSLMVFNDTQSAVLSLAYLVQAQCTPHLPVSAFKDGRNCSHSCFTDKQTK